MSIYGCIGQRARRAGRTPYQRAMYSEPGMCRNTIMYRISNVYITHTILHLRTIIILQTIHKETNLLPFLVAIVFIINYNLFHYL